MTTRQAADIGEEELRRELEQLLSQHFGEPRRIAELQQRPNPYRSSFAIQEIDLVLDDGRSLELILKDLSRHTLEAGLHAAKPAFAHDPAREIEVYRAILAREQLGTALCYGAVAAPERDTFWLLLERVPAERLAFIGEFETWEEVARWLAGMHERFTALMPALSGDGAERLLRYDGDFYRRWLEHAQAVVAEIGVAPVLARRLDHLASVYDGVIERLVALPRTIVHGEFYADNVLVARDEGGLRVCPVDWEMAGFAPGIVDVAGLTAGSWTADERCALALAYHGALEGERPPADDFLAAVAFYRIHLAVHWAGVETSRGDGRRVERWLTEGLDTADALGL